MKRKLIVAGNWKMNKTYMEGRDLTINIIENLQPSDVLVILCPPFVHLSHVCKIIKEISNLKLGAQNCHQAADGAYTGEVSAPMLRSIGAEYVIIGHSERREYFGEDDDLLAEKITRVLDTGLSPIFCCGEKLDVRDRGDHEALVARQVETGLFHLTTDQFQKVILAYEPVWAIGTGRTASPEQAQEMHAFIRDLIRKKYGEPVANSTSILYGGSVKPSNALELFRQPDVDGGLIGGASLQSEDFVDIVHAMRELSLEGAKH